MILYHHSFDPFIIDQSWFLPRASRSLGPDPALGAPIQRWGLHSASLEGNAAPTSICKKSRFISHCWGFRKQVRRIIASRTLLLVLCYAVTFHSPADSNHGRIGDYLATRTI
jgi:hypothetical protein